MRLNLFPLITVADCLKDFQRSRKLSAGGSSCSSGERATYSLRASSVLPPASLRHSTVCSRRLKSSDIRPLEWSCPNAAKSSFDLAIASSSQNLREPSRFST